MPTTKPYDDVAWAISTQIWEDWPELLRTDGDIYNDIGIILSEEFGNLEWTLFEYLQTGGFNTCFKMEFTNNSAAVIRFPIPGAVMFPEEKVRNEVSIMCFLSDKSSERVRIPVPSIWRMEQTTQTPSALGPFIIMSYIDHKKSMADLLEAPGFKGCRFLALNPDLGRLRLEHLYAKLAKVVLSLSTFSFARIGSITKTNDASWEALDRPLSYSMNEIVQLGTVSRSDLPTTTYDKSSSYFEALAELHILHLKSQRNEANIKSDVETSTLADDFRRRFVARFLFRKLVYDREQRKDWIAHDDGPFPIWCDDFRPENVLLDETEDIAGVVDWEYTYTAPVEFVHAPPWWLLLIKPEDWPDGLDDWCIKYEKSLEIFLAAMRKCEDDAIQGNLLTEDQRLSSRMQKSWLSGNFWIMYAARSNFAFDAIYWEKIDQRFFEPILTQEVGIRDVWRKRLSLLQPEERQLMEEYVDQKLKDGGTERLAWEPGEYTKAWIEKLKDKRGSSR